MQIVATPAEARSFLDDARCNGATVGFVPTMGYLHEGHASLMRAARESCDVVAVSIFVNPLQFGPAEDFSRYPRDEARDEALCERELVDLVLRPDVGAMAAVESPLSMTAGSLGTRLCGASRPGHFDGVATIVAKLFNISGPCRAFFGEKDAQQLVVIRRLVETFLFPVEVVGMPTVREGDGLAMSSRNAYLSDEERSAATILSRALFEARDAVAGGERDARRLVAAARQRIGQEPLAEIDYVAAVDPRTLEDLERLDGAALLALAVRFPSARLIDNLVLDPSDG